MANQQGEKRNAPEQAGTGPNQRGTARPETGRPESGRPETGMQRSGGGPAGGRGLAQRGQWTPSIFSLSPREFFSASPFELMRRFSEEMDRAFEGMNRGPGGWSSSPESSHWAPVVEIFERDNQLVVCAELPGLRSEDVHVEMTEDGLVIQGERQREHEEQGEGWYRTERSYGQFYRMIPLPEGVDAEQAQAQFENGVLEIKLPLPAAQQRRRQIPVNSPQSTGGKTAPQSHAAKGGSSKG